LLRLLVAVGGGDILKRASPGSLGQVRVTKDKSGLWSMDTGFGAGNHGACCSSTVPFRLAMPEWSGLQAAAEK
jgi:hypothetical protein